MEDYVTAVATNLQDLNCRRSQCVLLPSFAGSLSPRSQLGVSFNLTENAGVTLMRRRWCFGQGDKLVPLERRDFMGKVTRKRYGAEFKAKVALEGIKGELTLAELSTKLGIQ